MNLPIEKQRGRLKGMISRVVNLRAELDKIQGTLTEAVMLRDFLAYQIREAEYRKLTEFNHQTFIVHKRPKRINKRPYFQ